MKTDGHFFVKIFQYGLSDKSKNILWKFVNCMELFIFAEYLFVNFNQLYFMWKDFFYFTRRQRYGIIIFAAIVLLALLVNYLLPLLYPSDVPDGTGYLAEVASFKKQLHTEDSVKSKFRKTPFQFYNRGNYSYYKNNFESYEVQKYHLSPFDPNTTDSAGFVKLGLKPYIASNILRYRSKSGKFRSTADFAKVYGIQPEKMKELEPYIRIDAAKLAHNDSLRRPSFKADKLSANEDVKVEINSADTALLRHVKGIGKVFANRIVAYRNSCGGYLSVDQLKEVYGMTQEDFERIAPFCVVNKALVKKIRVNTASVDLLNHHPYINFYQAKAIYELRRKKGKLQKIEELSFLSEFTNKDLEKIAPYLSFE